MTAHFPDALALRATTRAVGRRLAIYAFMVAVGLLGGRILAAAWMFNELGWTATWLEISHWGPSYQPEPNRTFEIGRSVQPPTGD